jgi:glutathione synthase/RimK-type ligase-like ATP-grasp enzyme
MSHPDAIRNASHKLPQLRIARDLGFRIPETLMSNNPAEIRDFHSMLKDRGAKLAAKLISKGPPRADHPDGQYVVFTQILSESDLQNDAVLGICPAMYQEYVEKAFELRVTVVGDEIFACEIHSQKSDSTLIDWRRYDFPSTPHLVHDSSPDLVRRCLELTKHYRLEFAAIDLIVTPAGETVFLELNPNGQWGWIEELTGLPIANAIARHLARS